MSRQPIGRARSQRFRPDQDVWLKQRAAATGKTEAGIVREALDEKIARETRE